MKMQYDSRHVQPGDIFLALPGLTVDGRQFIQQALDRGASKIYYEAKHAEQFAWPQTDVPLIAIDNLCEKQGALAAEFYAHPSHELTVIGITGTNGKTSVSYFLAQCLQDAALLGTTGYGQLKQIKKLNFTTPMASDVHFILKELSEDNIKTVAMEVSSHALSQQRVGGVEFDMAVFTNLSHEHLDFHGDMQSYAKAKKKLFHWPTLQHAVVNSDDAVGRDIVKECRVRYPIITYAMHQAADIFVSDIKETPHGFHVNLHTPQGTRECFVPLLGRFNIANCLAVVGVLGVMGMSLDEIVEKIAQLTTPPGRMQIYHAPGKPTVVVDFAHTPDALKNVLLALREHCTGEIYAVFGCGGDRDASKRKPMGEIATTLADHVLITNDNPRHESPQHIAKMICQGVDTTKLLGVELNRRAAIEQAITTATENDIILIAGKGHENFQIIGDETLPFNDGKEVMKALKLKK